MLLSLMNKVNARDGQRDHEIKLAHNVVSRMGGLIEGSDHGYHIHHLRRGYACDSGRRPCRLQEESVIGGRVSASASGFDGWSNRSGREADCASRPLGASVCSHPFSSSLNDSPLLFVLEAAI